MKNYKGFTLSEVLITLALIGVVAGMTLPVISSSNVVMKKQVVATLAKAFNTLEMANSNLLQTTDSMDILSACNYTIANFKLGGYFGCLKDKNVLKTTPITSADNLSCFATKDGTHYCHRPTSGLTKASNPSSSIYYGYYFNTMIDTNGLKGPNELAKDRFTVFLDLNGTVIAPGSYEYNDYNGTSDSKNKPQKALWEDYCKNNTVQNKNYCTGSIVDNGWQIKYKY